MKIINIKTIILTSLLLLLLSSCADVSPHYTDCITSNPYGFLSGFWHGLIIPYSFTGSVINDGIAIYAYNNNGGFYDFGFIIGMLISVILHKILIKDIRYVKR